MGKHRIRKNKTCQNCGFFVDKNYCPNCGQMNSDSRQTFHHVFTHFVSDLFHYDSSFWRTTKYLLLYPGRLSLEYMKGKRKSYVNPFTLYIFISFIAFFIPSVLPDTSASKEKETKFDIGQALIYEDSIKAASKKNESENLKLSHDSLKHKIADKLDFTDSSELASNSKIKQILGEIIKNAQDKEKGEKAFEFFIHNLPKVLFIYMPFFAFWLWLFHNKKKKYYFDSAIFTLHFFSILLLTITIAIVISYIFDLLNLGNAPYTFLYLSAILYITFYFFRGNRVFFEESRTISNIKSFFLMGINNFFIFIFFFLYVLFVLYVIYT